MSSAARNLEPDIEQAKWFLEVKDQTLFYRGTPFFKTFDDDRDRKDPSLKREFRGSIEDYWGNLVDLNKRGAGVYVAVNQVQDGQRRIIANMQRICAFYQEDDDGFQGTYSLKPNIVVQTSPGKHHRYWVVFDDTKLSGDTLNDLFKPIERRFEQDYGSDPNATDITRVLRVPGFYHQKKSQEKGQTGKPFMVTLVEALDKPYRLEQITAAFPPVEPVKPKSTATKKPGSECKVVDEEIIEAVRSAFLYSCKNDGSYIDKRPKWVETGIALKLMHEVRGREIWDEGCKESNKYRDSTQDEQWGSFHPSGKKTYLSIFRDAKILGWTDPKFVEVVRAEFEDAPVDEETGSAEQTTLEKAANVAVIKTVPLTLKHTLENHFLISRGDRVGDKSAPPDTSVLKLSEHRNKLANVSVEVPDPKNLGKTKWVTLSSAWLSHRDRQTCFDTTYDPNHDRIVVDDQGNNFYNTFHMTQFEATNDESMLGLFMDHLEYLIPDSVEREWFKQWLAFNLQRPGTRSKVTPLLVSGLHGTGRGWIVELLWRLLGRWNCTKSTIESLFGQGGRTVFLNCLLNSLLCVFEEVKEGARRYELSAQMRGLMTEPYLEINSKYGSLETRPVFTNLFMMSNHRDALVLPVEDRRVNVISGPDTVQSQAYYTELYDWLETDGVRQLHSWLMRKDLTNFNWTRSMRTKGRAAMIQNNQTDTEIAFRDFLDEPPHPVMTQDQIVRHLNKSGATGNRVYHYSIDENQIRKLLQQTCQQANGGKQIRLENGLRVRGWVFNKTVGTSLDNAKVSLARAEFGHTTDF